MQTVNINKIQLLEILHKNKSLHTDQYNESVEIYKKAARIYYSDLADKAAKDPMNLPVYDPPDRPTSYVSSYDNAIEMLGYETESVVSLSQKEFKEYVKNEWSWADRFLSFNRKNSSYL